MSDSQRRSPRRTLLTLISTLSLLGALLVSVTPALAAAEHCDDHATNLKINASSFSNTYNGVQISWSGDPGSVTFKNTNATEATVVWCAKGGTDFAGPGNKALEKMTTVLDPDEQVTAGPFGTEISYFVLYSVTVTPPTDPPGGDEEPNTGIDKSASQSVLTRGEPFSYTLTIRNNGDAVATNVHVWDDLDRDITITNIAASQGTCDLVTPANDLDCWLGDLAAGASATITIDIDTEGADCETIDNQAFVQAANEESARNSEVVEVTIECDDDASLKVLKTDEEGSPLEGAVFTVEGLQGTFETDEDGAFCITGLLENTEWLVTEIQAPEGYELADPASQMVDVDDDGDCDSPEAVFVNTRSESSPSEEESPSQEESPTEEESATEEESPTNEGVQGGNPTPTAGELPDTATGGMSVPAWIVAVIFLISLASLVAARLVTERSR